MRLGACLCKGRRVVASVSSIPPDRRFRKGNSPERIPVANNPLRGDSGVSVHGACAGGRFCGQKTQAQPPGTER